MTFKLINVNPIQELFEQSGRYDLPGYSIAILDSGECIDQLSFGLAEIENKVPITNKSRFHVASLAKQFTGFAIGLLEKNGKLKSSDMASCYLPEMEILKQGITINHLLHHTSGLRDQWVLLELAGWRGNDTICTKDVLSVITAQKGLNYLPGSRFLYSNSGYTLLAEIVSRITGMSFPQYIDENILIPLEMNNSLFIDNPNEIIPNRSYAYSSSINADGAATVERFFPNLYAPGATSFITTIEDLVNWDNNYWAEKIGDKELNQQLRRLGSNSPERKTGYGFGYFYERNKYGEMVFHSGMDFGFQSFYGQYISNGISVVILSNSNPSNIFALANNIAVSYIGKPVVSSVHFDVHLDESEDRNMEEYCGTYENKEYDDLWIVETSKNNLTIRSSGKVSLEPLSKDRFQFSGSLIECEFVRGNDDKIYAVTIIGIRDDVKCIKLIDNKETCVCLSKMVGKYWSQELDSFAYIEHSENIYELRLSKNDNVEITSITKDIFSAGGYWIRPFCSALEHGFTLSDARVKRIKYISVNENT